MPEVIFNGTEGRLEGRYHHAKGSGARVALVLHPHPLHGCSMNNRVVFATYQEFQRRGFSVLRFNFRGVGRSQGRYDNGNGELSDGASALDWIESINPNAGECWIAGYSFGAWIGMQLMMRRPEITRFISIAPPAAQQDFTFLAPCPASGLIISGGLDEVAPRAPVNKLVNKLSSQKNITIEHQEIATADHTFTGCLDTVARTVGDYMDRALTTAPA